MALLREHLDVTDDRDLLDPDSRVRAVDRAADALQAWHERGRRGARPPGRLRPHRTRRLPWHQRLWAVPAYRVIYDPDGRARRDRRAGHW
ncbi:hypothetical protein [Plantactinospora sp. B5E13]|uniref:hypothetical protein n=1 Tax=Plantactinospora sp. B5E13 TaxID=3153758 RepID=UPI00325EFD3B